MKKLMRKCKKALVIALAIILVGTSVDTSTLYVRAENATDVTSENDELQNQPGEGGEGDELQNQPGEMEGSEELQTQLGVLEGGEELKNQPGETEVDYEDLSRLEEDDFIFGGEEIMELPEPGTSVPAMGFFSLADGNVTLAAGNHVEYIDRIDLSDDTDNLFKTLYENFGEWSDNDGQGDWMINGEMEQYLVTVVEGKATAATGQSIADAVAEEASAIFSKYSQYIWAVANAFDRDHPEVFWLGGTPVSAGWSYSPSTGDYYVSIYLVFHKVNQDGSVSDIRAERYRDVNVLKTAIATMNTNANAILAEAEGLDTVGKIKYFNEKLTKINEYNTIVSSGLDDSNVNRDTWECVSALAGQTGEVGPVCEAYARAFKVLCDRSGIPCILEDGYAGGPHMWNAVQVEGNWYATDVTWNDPTGGNSGAISGNENERWLLVGTETVINGKAFAVSHITQNSPSGTLQYLNGPVLSTEKYVVSNIVAEVTVGVGDFAVTKEYENLSEAIAEANANTDSVLKLRKNIEWTSNITIEGDFTWDLNGYTLDMDEKMVYIFSGSVTLCDSNTGQNGKITGTGNNTVYVSEGAAFTLNGGTVENLADANINIAVWNFGTLTVNNGTIKTTNTAEEYYSTAIRNDGVLYITGGTVECSGASSANYPIENVGTAYISGGIVKNTCAESPAIVNDGSLNISGTATVMSDITGEAVLHCGGTFELSGAPVITGGTYGDIELIGTTVTVTGALSNTTPYSVLLCDTSWNETTGVFAEGGVDPNGNSSEAYVLTASDAAKFTAMNEALVVKQDTANNQLLLGYVPHEHSAPMTFETPWTATSGTVTAGSYYLTEDVEAYHINIEGTVAICLNGHTLDMGTSYFNVPSGTSLVIYDCSTNEKGAITGEGAITLLNYGSVVLEGGQIINTAQSDGKALENGGTVIICGGSLQCTGEYAYAIYNHDGASLLLEGGSLQCTGENSVGVFSAEGSNFQMSGEPVVEALEADLVIGTSAQIRITGALTGEETYTLEHYGEVGDTFATASEASYLSNAKEKFVPIGDYTEVVVDGTTASLDYKKGDIPIGIYWQDDDNSQGLRPTEVTVNFGVGEDVLETVTLKASENWTVTLEDMYLYDEYGQIYYWIEVVNGSKYYAFAQSESAEDGYAIVAKGHELYLSQSLNGVENTQAVEILCVGNESEECDWSDGNYQLVIDAEDAFAYDGEAKAATIENGITDNVEVATVSEITYYVKSGDTWTVVEEAVEIGTYKAEVTVTLGSDTMAAWVEFEIILLDITAPVVEVIEPTKEAGTLKDTSATFTVESDEDATALLQVIYNYSGEELELVLAPFDLLPEEFFESFDVYPFGEQVELDDPEAKMSAVFYKVALKAGEAQTFTITGLLPNTEYLYVMLIYDEAHNVSVVGTPTDEEYIYDCLTFTTLKTVPTFDEAPTITGTYGDMLSEMTLSQPVSTNGVAGTWSIVYEGAEQRYDMPEVSGTTAYTVKFTPEDTEACETVTVQVVPSVAKMPLTVKIDNQTRVYGEENPELTYTITQGSIVDANDAGRPKLTIALSTTATKASNAGVYDIIGTVTNDVNYDVTVLDGILTIGRAQAVITVAEGADSWNKTFGDESFVLSGISTNSDGTLTFEANNDVVSVDANGKVTIKGAGHVWITVRLDETENYTSANPVEISVDVERAVTEDVYLSKDYLYLKDNQESIDLTAYVPADAGEVSYELVNVDGDCEFTQEPTVTNGKLSYTVKAGETGNSASLWVSVNSDNYEGFTVDVTVTLVDKTPVAEKSGSEVSLKNNTLTYGEALSKLEFNEAVFVAEGTGEVVSGTLAWENPANEPTVATTKATWVFTPDDDKYMSVTGELAIVVKKAVQPAFSIEDLGEIEYFPGGDERTPVTTIGGVEDGEVTITVPANNNVIRLDADNCFEILNAGTVTITAVCVDPYGNYEDATATYELTILPYKLTASQIWWEEGVTGAETYDGTAKEPAIWMYMISGPLTEGTDYTVTYENNVEVYTLTEADAGFDASKAPAVVVTGKGNYTGTVKKYFVINKAEASITVENYTYTKTFGDDSFALTGITKVGDGTLVYTIKDSKNAAGQAVAQDKVLTVDANGKVTIVGAGSAVITVNMAETENYKAAEEVSIIVNVAKASYTTEAIERGYAYNKDNADSVDLTEKLPADIQNASFAISKTDGDASFTVAPAIDATGKLTYTLKKGTKGQYVALGILVSSDNYKDFYITVEMELAYEAIVVLKEGSEVAVTGELTYGDALSKLPFAEAVFVEEGTDIVVEGTLSFETPDAVLDVETTEANWVFTPADANYAPVKGTVTIKINKAQQPEFSIVPVTDASYGMEGSVWLETTGGMEGAEITFSVPENNGVVTAVNKNGQGKSFVVPIGSGKVLVTAVAVDPEGNYEDAIATYELNVAPASISANWISWLDGFTGAGTYNGSEITPGVKVYFIAEGILTEGEDYTVSYVNNTNAYTLKEGDEGFDAAKAPAVVVTGKGNYTGSAKVYFVINKAENAPNMPKSTQTVASHIAAAGQVSLPTDWIWQEPNTALTEGGETIAVAVYNGADKGNYVKEEVSVTITRMEAGAPYVSKINGTDVDVIEKGWQNVSDTLSAAVEGDTITVEMNGVTVLLGNVIDNIKGKNITVELNMGNGVTWIINGKDITATTVEDVDLKVDLNTTNIPVEVINKITGEISTMQISLAHDGNFGYKAFMRINLDVANAGYYAQLFHYEEASKVLKYMNQSKIDGAGYVELPFTHASEYTIVIDDVAYQVPGSGGNGGGSSAPAATPTPAPTQAPPTTKLPNTADEFPLEGILLLMMVCMAAFGGTVAYGKCKKAGRK